MFDRLKAALRRERVQQTLRIEPEGVELEMQPGQSLLEAILARRIPYPHNCTVGTCGSCKTLLKTGRVKARADFAYTLSKPELEAGFILACQAVAIDETTVIELPEPSRHLPTPREINARITGKELLTHDILNVTVTLDSPLDFVAGQYASVRALEFDRARHYSFADAPKRGGRSEFNFFIRRVNGGAFTEALFEGKLDNQRLSLSAPHGDFHLLRGHAPMICVAGGSGLAPILSLLDDARMRRIRRRTVLIFGARTVADLYLIDRIDELKRTWPESFDFIPILSEESADSGWTGRRGMATDLIDPTTIDLPWNQSEGYLCGPPRMVDAGVERLIQLGVPVASIRYDKFIDAYGGGSLKL